MSDTICAVATPPGRGGIGIVRVSGPACKNIARQLLGTLPKPRHAAYSVFRNSEGEVLDEGIALYFPAPGSYTGEDVLELQGHGSPVALERLVNFLLTLGARLANPGEFTERAFRNDKLDLAQAEAVADLISSSSVEAARAATRSLTGEFSSYIHKMDQEVLQLRMYVESAIDFAEEEIDFLDDEAQRSRLQNVQSHLDQLLERTATGATMQMGLNVAIGGAPNVGKSSILNGLLGESRAIVTEIAGTTRDEVQGEISLDGLPIRFSDTAGLRETADPVEAIGVDRARDTLRQADCVLWVVVDGDPDSLDAPPSDSELVLVRNKCDLSEAAPGRCGDKSVRTCALTGAGFDDLRAELKRIAGFQSGQDAFAGRPRHIEALQRAQAALSAAKSELEAKRGELVAENLRLAHQCFGEIVGETSADDLLGEIFSTFCIGK